eukprot:sb/3470037/
MVISDPTTSSCVLHEGRIELWQKCHFGFVRFVKELGIFILLISPFSEFHWNGLGFSPIYWGPTVLILTWGLPIVKIICGHLCACQRSFVSFGQFLAAPNLALSHVYYQGKHECCDHDPGQCHQWRRKSIQRRVKKRKAGSCSGTSKQPIRTRYLGHVTGYHPIRDQYFLIQSGPMATKACNERSNLQDNRRMRGVEGAECAREGGTIIGPVAVS